MTTKTHEDVQNYYGRILSGKNDLKTTACCATATPPKYIRNALANVPAEVHQKFYGCGLPFPAQLQGTTILDLGSGSGRDCFVLSQLSGPKGRVIGVDMTPEQVEVATRHNSAFAKSNAHIAAPIEFRTGFIENLRDCDIADNTVDVVISNCVVNLSPRKDLVLAEIARVLKPGGELYFSDVYSDRRLSEELQNDPIVVGECLGGALYFQDFRRMMAQVGFADFRIVARNPVDVTSDDIRKKTGAAKFESITVRAFKLKLEDACEDYGQAVQYLGGIENSEEGFLLDDHHYFEKGKVLPICQNTAKMLSETRFASYFKVFGDTLTHYGLFDCGPNSPSASSSTLGGSAEGACC